MIKPRHLKAGDKIAIVSSSKGTLGESWAIHKLGIAEKRLREDFNLEVKVMPNALKGIDYLYKNPQARADDLIQAFEDSSIKGIFNAIGGDDAIRLLPFIDYKIFAENPKIFTGFSDTTNVHLMLNKAGLISYYGASVMTNFSEYVSINSYTLNSIRKTLFEPEEKFEIKSSPYWYDDEDEKIWWKEENINRQREYHPETVGYEVVQGTGSVTGELLGGCLDSIIGLLGTQIWPSKNTWKDKIMFLETSEEDISVNYLIKILRCFAAQGIFDVIKGIIVGKPARRSKYEMYKEAYRTVVGFEAGQPQLPILFNVNFGHAEPIGVIPYGIKCLLDLDNKKITLLEKATE